MFLMKHRHTLFFVFLMMMSAWGLSSCEKMIVDEAQEPATTDKVEGNLILHISLTGLTPMQGTRSEEPSLGDYFTTLNLVAYQEGKKVKGPLTQKVDSPNFGTLSMKLEPGTYQVLVVAHSSKGNPDFPNLEKIKFANDDGFSDTFYSFSDIEVSEEAREHNITMSRITSMLRFIINDTIPDEVKYIDFLMTGGSGAFDAYTGYGCVNSTQRFLFPVDHTVDGPHSFDLYTILWPTFKEDGIHLVVTPRKDEIAAYSEGRDFNIHIDRNVITEYSGYFFSEAPGGDDNGDNDEDPNSGEDPGDDTGNTEQGDSISTSFNIGVNVAWADTIRGTY